MATSNCEKVMQVSEKPLRCPICNGKVVPIVYGEPSCELFEAAERGEVVLGGCCIEVDENGCNMMPSWVCVDCKTEFIEQ